MATVGFKSVMIGIFDELEKITKIHTIDAKEGGSIDLKISGLAPQLTTVYASDSPFFVGGKGSSAPKAEIGIFDLPDECFRDVTGAELVNGMTRYTSESRPPYVSILGQMEGPNNEDLYVALAKGKLTQDSFEAKTAEDKGVEVSTDTLSGDFVARKSDKLIYTKSRSTEVSFDYKKLLADVFPGYTFPVEEVPGS